MRHDIARNKLSSKERRRRLKKRAHRANLTRMLRERGVRR